MPTIKTTFKGTMQKPGGDIEQVTLVLAQEVGNPIMLQGEATAIDSNHIIRSMRFRLRPGATPGTNITISDNPSTPEIYQYNAPVLTDGTDLGKSATVGSYSLDSTGQIITVNTAEKVAGILSAAFVMHNLNTSSTTEMYSPWTVITSDALTLSVIKRGSNILVDWTSILDANDECQIQVNFITDS